MVGITLDFGHIGYRFKEPAVRKGKADFFAETCKGWGEEDVRSEGV